MTCEQAIVFMNLALDGILEPQQAQSLEAHLSQCDNCRKRYVSYQEIVRSLGSLEEETPVHLHETIMTAVNRERRRKVLDFPKITAAVCTIAAMIVLVIAINTPLWSQKNLIESTDSMALFVGGEAAPAAGKNGGDVNFYQIDEAIAQIEEAALVLVDDYDLDLSMTTGYASYLVVTGNGIVPDIFEEYRLVDGYLYAEVSVTDIESVTRQLTAAGFVSADHGVQLPAVDEQSEFCLVIVRME